MAMKTSLLLLAYCAASAGLYAQSTVTGVVQDATGKGVSFATVALLQAPDSALVKGIPTDEAGRFTFRNVKTGRYWISVTGVGYQPVHSVVFEMTKAVMEVPVLQLTQTARTLAEVQVQGQKPLYEQQMDRMVVNVQSSITGAGGTILDVLERAPGLSVNRQSNTVAIQGKANVAVMINGKVSRLPLTAVLQQLKGLAASTVEKIEIFTNPPARYDAEGDAGLINIVLKNNPAGEQTPDGTTGQISLTGGYGWYPRSGGSLMLNHRRDRATFYLTYSLVNDKFLQRIINYRTIPVGGSSTRTDLNINRTATQTDHNLRTGIDFNLGKKTTVGVMLTGYSNQFKTDSHSQTNITQGTVRSRIEGNMRETHHWQHLMGNASLRHQFTPDHTLTFDLDYLYYFDNNPYQYANRYTIEEQTTTREERFNLIKQTPIRVSVVKADYVRPIGTKSTLEAGIKGSLFGLVNRITLTRLEPDGWRSDDAFNRHDRLAETIGAVYASMNTRFSEKSTLVVGLRTEYTRSQMHDAQAVPLVNRRYWSLFPNVLFSRKISDKQNYQLSYSRRITRPPFDLLASFSVFWDPLFFMTGNSGLQPTFADIVQANYSLNRYTLSLRYSHDRNPMSRFIPSVNPATNSLTFRADNLDRADALALTLTLPVTIRPWWQSQNSLMVMQEQSQYILRTQTYRINQLGGQINTSHSIRLPHQFTAEVTAWYASPTVNGFSRQVSRGEVTIGLQKKLSANRGTLTASVSDLFWTNPFSSVTKVPDLALDTGTRFYLSEPRVVRLSYTRGFGNQKINNNRRNTASDEERKRVN